MQEKQVGSAARQFYAQQLRNYWQTEYEAYATGDETYHEFLEEYTIEPRPAYLPEPVWAAYALYDRYVQRESWGAVQLLQVPTEVADTFAVYVTTDGDDGWLEVYDVRGQLLGAGRTYIELVYWGDVKEIRAQLDTRTLPGALDTRATLWGKPF
ncbi:MAG: hypothetical protein HC876_01115 [Chloroflexaceae bacterium]|nr:hypothetical protein [Chloroflexaceae bacterium]